jgi:predicted nucleotidyltransferase
MAHSAPDFTALLTTLVDHEVEFIVVGGVAAVLHGAPVTTFDLDLVHARTPGNLGRLMSALVDLDAHYRGRGDQRLRPTTEHLSSTGHHLLMTRYGPLQILGTIGQDHDFDALLQHTSELMVAKLRLRVLILEKLIAVKEEVGHEKDMMVLPTLKRTLDEKSRK